MALCMNSMDDDHDGFADCMDRSCQTLAMCIVDTSIVDIQNGTVAEGTRVRLADKIVTAVATSLIWIQDAAQGAPNNGVVVFPTMMPTGLAVGDHVDVEGSVTEYYDATEVEFATITKLVTAPTTPIAVTIANPLDLVAAATAEPYEGVLVKVSNVKVLAAPAAPGNEWIVGPSGTMAAMGLHVDDTMLKIGSMAGQIMPTVGTCYLSITGPLDYSFMNYKIEPRSLADAVQPGGTCP